MSTENVKIHMNKTFFEQVKAKDLKPGDVTAMTNHVITRVDVFEKELAETDESGGAVIGLNTETLVCVSGKAGTSIVPTNKLIWIHRRKK